MRRLVLLEKYFSNIEKNYIKYFLSAKRMKNFENNYLVKKYFFNSSENLKKKILFKSCNLSIYTQNCILIYFQTKDELQRVRRELVKSPKSPKTSLAAQAILRRVETERDDALQDLRRMTTERDSLRERLKIATETSLSDRAKLEQKIEDLDSALHHVNIFFATLFS